MNRDFLSLPLKKSYQTNPDDLARDFYAPLISQSKLIRRAVGYFRSTAYLLLHEEILDFFRQGGRIEIVCSPEMSPDDIEIIRQSIDQSTQFDGKVAEVLLREAFLNEIAHLRNDSGGEMHLSLLAGMLRHNLAEFKIAVLLKGHGIYHEKRGIAHDECGQVVAFFGSANETLSGWGKDGNVESIDVFRSWVPEDQDRVADHVFKFEQVWSGSREGLLVKSLPMAVRERLLEAKPIDQDEFYRTLQAYQSLRRSQLLPKPLDDNPAPEPPFAIAPEGLRTLDPHQVEALNAWLEAGRRGLLKLATGAGKTLIALRAIRTHTDEGFATLILVPSQLLLKQWRREIEAEMPEAIVLLAGDGNVKWRRVGYIEAFLAPNSRKDRQILLATMQTASSLEFRSRLRANLVKDLLLVADEVHQIGSPENQNLLQIQAGARLGLSATPERFGDPEGTERIFDYFGGIVGPVITLSDAIKARRLVPYRYYPHFVSLNEDERGRWRELTLKLKKLYAFSQRDGAGKPVDTLRSRLLKIQRSWIPKKAAQKVVVTQSILRKRYETGQHWLIYCEDRSQLSDVAEACKTIGINPLVYHSAMNGEASATLSYFVQFGGVLISIRCLDEGIDIPIISHAIILASSQNPRQFIQRRGRVLRWHEGKNLAEIHDVLVIPVDPEADEQDTLTLSEFKRAIEFADDAINQTEASVLREKAVELGLLLSDIYEMGTEDETDDDREVQN